MEHPASKVGAWASGLCAVHCALTGILVALAPLVLPEWLHDLRIEAVLLSVTALFGGYTAAAGWARHRRAWPSLLLVLGFFAVLGGSVLAHRGGSGHAVSLPSSVLSLAGGALLVAFFVANGRLSAHCSCPACSQQQGALDDSRARLR